MAGDEGKENSSDAVSLPPEPTAAAASRPIFISYASHDAAVAQKVCSALEAAGFACWIAPRNVVPGSLYADGIVHAIDESSLLVLILSEHAVTSTHVGREIERAVSKRHPVIALRIDAAPLTAAFEYFLNQSQWIEGGGSDATIAQLVGAVGQHLAPGTATSSTNPNRASAVHWRSSTARWRWVIAAVVAVGLAGGSFLLNKAWRSKHETTASTVVISDKSIAVLPFTDMSEKKDQEYFADGMAEEIINLLVKIPKLKVIGRTSSFQFKGKTEDLRAIGTQLGVAYVLEGSVRKSGDRLRVTAQLIDSRDGTHLFSETYDRDLSDVLKMQDEIAIALVRALQIEVDPGDLISRPALRNPEAYTLFLQGWHAADGFDQQGLEQALSDFERVRELDPSSAAAANACGAVYSILGGAGLMPPTIAYEKARKSIEDALRLDPTLAIAHSNLGVLHRLEWNWAAADREMQTALALAPRDALVLLLAAGESLIMGRWDDSVKLVNAALAVDPLNAGSYWILAFAQLPRGRMKEAEAAARRAFELNPKYLDAHLYFGAVLLANGEAEAALPAMLKETDEPARLLGSAIAYFALGRKTDSDAALAKLIQRQDEHHAFRVAQVYAFRGESDEALLWLDRAYAQRDGGLVNLEQDPGFRKLLGDPRYKTFLRKMNLPYD
jgi:TolB-like protein/Flp pilus assembly protein TadD